jgi:hypothetical protein
MAHDYLTNEAIREGKPPSRMHADLLSEFGAPEAVFSPSSGQTAIGLLLGLGSSLVGLIGLIGSLIALDWPILLSGLLGGGVWIAGSLGLAFWIWRWDKWRLLVCPNGVIQMWAWGVEQIRWSEITEVVELRNDSPNGRLMELKLVGATATICINNRVNFDSTLQMLQVVLEAARKRSLPIRVQVRLDVG